MAKKRNRKQKRKIKKNVKRIFIAIAIIVATIGLVTCIIIFGFKLKTVKVKSDINQYTEQEVKNYFYNKKIDNTFVFWFKNLIGKQDKIEMFSKYTVTMDSPWQVTVRAYEKRLSGYIKYNDKFLYIDNNGVILKSSTEKIKDIPKITGIAWKKVELYNKAIPVKNEQLETLMTVINQVEEYNFDVKKINVDEKNNSSIFVKKIQIDLGSTSQLSKKLLSLNDMYKDVIKYNGTLNMKHFSTDGSYTLKKTVAPKETKKAKNSKKN